MSICACFIAWEISLSQPELAKDKINFFDSTATEISDRSYAIKNEFNQNYLLSFNRINLNQFSDNLSKLNLVDYSSNLFLFPWTKTVKSLEKEYQPQKKNDGKFPFRTNSSSLGSSSISSTNSSLFDGQFNLANRSPNYLNTQLITSPKIKTTNLASSFPVSQSPNNNGANSSLKLNPDENPLVIPTEPQEVEIDKLAPLTLEEAIELAEANNRGLKIAKLELEQAKSALNAEKAAWFPSVGVQSGLTREQSPSGEVGTNIERDLLRKQIATIPALEAQLAQSNDPIQKAFIERDLQQARNARNELNDLENFATTTIDGSVGVQFSLLSPQRQAAIKIAREEVRFNELEVQNVQQILRLQVADAYYNLQQADREVAIAEKDVKTRQQGVEIVKKLLDAALATRLDLLNAEVELDNAIQVLRLSQSEQLIARRDIAQILSLPASVTPTAADRVAIKDLWDLSLEETIILAFQNRVELEQQLAQRRSGEAQRKLAWAAIKPQIGLFANYDFARFYSDESGDNAFRGFGDGYSVGVNFNWTFWDGGVASARAKEAKAVIAIAEQQYADSANQIRLDVEQAYFQLPANLENVETATEAVTRAEAAVEAAEIRFRANLNTQTEVLDARNRLVQAENNLVRAIIDYNRALAALQRAVGATETEIEQNK